MHSLGDKNWQGAMYLGALVGPPRNLAYCHAGKGLWLHLLGNGEVARQAQDLKKGSGSQEFFPGHGIDRGHERAVVP